MEEGRVRQMKRSVTEHSGSGAGPGKFPHPASPSRTGRCFGKRSVCVWCARTYTCVISRGERKGEENND